MKPPFEQQNTHKIKQQDFIQISGWDNAGSCSILIITTVFIGIVLPTLNFSLLAFITSVIFILVAIFFIVGQRFCIKISKKNIIFHRKWFTLSYFREEFPLHSELGLYEGFDFPAEGIYLKSENLAVIFGTARNCHQSIKTIRKAIQVYQGSSHN